MKLKGFDYYSWLVSFGLFSGLLLLFICFGFPGFSLLIGWVPCAGDIFCFDVVSRYLLLLSFVLWFSLIFFIDSLSSLSWVMIGLSVFSSVLSYCCIHALWFWVFYEMTILPLLFLLILDSPYSERYTAAWYFLGYIVLTSLPMLLCLFYLSLYFGSFKFNIWLWNCDVLSSFFILLAVLFITKIPLPPFHVWLPIVHAEATSAVSVCLSGYIMKLGILGVCRFCFCLLPDFVFCNEYILICFGFAVLFFFSACRELDGKRWLAFLSLSHILVACGCLCVSSFDNSVLSFLYCFGHGVSAGVTFIFLWLIYDVSGSRNWGVLKFVLSSSLLIRGLCASCICTVASLPPTVQFFCEVFVIVDSGFVSCIFVFVFFIFLFLGGVVPLFLLGTLLSRHYSVSVGGGYIFGFLFSVLFLLIWGFGLFLIS